MLQEILNTSEDDSSVEKREKKKKSRKNLKEENDIQKVNSCLKTMNEEIYGITWDSVLYDIAQNKIADIFQVAEYNPRKWEGSYSGYYAEKLKLYGTYNTKDMCEQFISIKDSIIRHKHDLKRVGCGVLFKTGYSFVICLYGTKVQVPRVIFDNSQ